MSYLTLECSMLKNGYRAHSQFSDSDVAFAFAQ